jgi:hypothetical protein
VTSAERRPGGSATSLTARTLRKACIVVQGKRVRDVPRGRKRPAVPIKRAVAKPLDKATQQLVERIVVVTPNGTPGKRLSQTGLIEILAGILIARPNKKFVGIITKRCLEGQRGAVYAKGSSNEYQVLDGDVYIKVWQT